MVNNIPVNGWPQLKDLEAVQPILNRLDKIEAWKRTVKEETFTGDEITIPNALALPARSLKTTINAIQDLHGYDHPWAGGADKNKLLITAVSSSDVLTVDSDGILKLNGTLAEATTVTFTVVNAMVNGTSYKYSFDGTFQNACALTIRGDYSVDIHNNSKEAEFTYNGGSIIFRINIGAGTYTNNIIKPMIRLATESDASFAPYSNICPISGRDSVVLTRSDGDEISEDFTIQLGTTVYGADIDWDTGVMTVKTATKTYTGETDEAWDGDVPTRQYWSTATINNKVKGTIDCNEFKGVQVTTWADLQDNQIALHPTVQNNVRVKYSGAADITAFRTFLASNPMQVCYELATPTTIQLTPEQLEMLKGYNRITLSDGYGTIELKALTGANWS